MKDLVKHTSNSEVTFVESRIEVRRVCRRKHRRKFCSMKLVLVLPQKRVNSFQPPITVGDDRSTLLIELSREDRSSLFARLWIEFTFLCWNNVQSKWRWSSKVWVNREKNLLILNLHTGFAKLVSLQVMGLI